MEKPAKRLPRGQVKFIRVNGRIIPIPKEKYDLSKSVKDGRLQPGYYKKRAANEAKKVGAEKINRRLKSGRTVMGTRRKFTETIVEKNSLFRRMMGGPKMRETGKITHHRDEFGRTVKVTGKVSTEYGRQTLKKSQNRIREQNRRFAGGASSV